jgi:hypothetical protein
LEPVNNQFGGPSFNLESKQVLSKSQTEAVIWTQPICQEKPYHLSSVGQAGLRAREIALLTWKMITDADAKSLKKSFKRFKISNEVPNLIGIEPEFRHGGVARSNALRERLLEEFNRISLVQRAKGRRDAQRARGHLVNRMALGAIRLRKHVTPLDVRVRRRSQFDTEAEQQHHTQT